MVRRRIVVVVALVGLVLGGGIAWAEPADVSEARGRGLLSRRVVKVFDFDERDEGNYDRLPRHWYVVTGPGFPEHTADLVGFDDAHAVSGKRSVKLASNGGSAALMLQEGVIAAVPGADYVFSVRLRTQDMERTRARVVAWFADQRGRRIDASEVKTEPLRSEARWQRVTLTLRGDHERAAWIMVRLELLQPIEFRPPLLGTQSLYRQDIDALAWFDDLSVFQLPRIDITPNAASGVIRQPDEPTLSMTVRDLTGEPLTATLSVYDESGNAVAHQTRKLDGRQAPTWTWRPELRRLGWYWADLVVTGDRGLVGRRSTAWVWLDRRTSIGDGQRRRWGIHAAAIEPNLRPLLPDVLEAMGGKRAIVDLWRAGMDEAELAEAHSRIDPVIAALLEAGHRVTVSLAGVPEPLARMAGVDADAPLSLFVADPRHWQAALKAAVMRYGHATDRWLIGSATNVEAFARSDAAAAASAVREQISRYVPGGKLLLPWSVQRAGARHVDAGDGLLIHVPASVKPEQVAAHLAGLDVPLEQATVMLDVLDPERFGHGDRAVDLLLRLVETWRLEPAAVVIDPPFNLAEARHPAGLPDPLLGVFASAIDRLAGRRIVGRVSLGPGLDGYILTAPAGGAIVAWNATAAEPSVTVETVLGDAAVERVDLWGNREAVTPVGGRHRVSIGREPVFLEGVDARLALFRAALRLDPAFVESSNKVHELALELTNPWPRTISGQLRFDPGDRWSIRPAVVRFTIPSGQSQRVPIELTFPIHELAGVKQIPLAVELEADRVYELDLPVSLEIGLRDIAYHPTLSIEPGRGDAGGRDVVISAQITNHGDRNRSLFAFALAPDQPRRQRIVSQLEPGQTIIKRFRFPAAADELAGASIRVGLREMNGPAMLNHKLEVP